MKTHFKTILKNFRDRSGNVTIELALIMSVFALMMLGGFEISRMAVEVHGLEQVARAGAQYALLGQANALDTDEVVTKTQEAAGDDADLITVTATTFCECPDGSDNDCSDTCAGSNVSIMYINVTVTKPYVSLFTLPDLFGSYTISGAAEMRIR